MATKRFYFEREETVITKTKGYIDLEMDFTQLYHNVFNFLKDVDDKWSILYVMWVIPKANKYGYIRHSKEFMQEFIDSFNKNNVTVPGIRTVQDSITKLVKHKVLIKHGYSDYQLNSEIFWNGTLKERKENIEHLISENKLLK